MDFGQIDDSGELADVHIRADASNLVTTASTTHQPEQKETMHLIQMRWKESNGGQVHDLAHVRSEYCLADCLTKSSAKAGEFFKSVLTGILPNVDVHPLSGPCCRTLVIMQHNPWAHCYHISSRRYFCRGVQLLAKHSRQLV